MAVKNEKNEGINQLNEGTIDEADEERKEGDEDDACESYIVGDDAPNQHGNYVLVTRKAYCVLCTHPQAAYPALFQVRTDARPPSYCHIYILTPHDRITPPSCFLIHMFTPSPPHPPVLSSGITNLFQNQATAVIVAVASITITGIGGKRNRDGVRDDWKGRPGWWPLCRSRRC